MADCAGLATCPFFNDKMPIDSGLGSMYKRTFCQGDSSNCARLIVAKALGKPAVPSTLYPNQIDKAKALLAGK